MQKNVQDSLNEQIAKEAYNSHYYLAMATWCANHGFHGSAAFFYRQSDGERGHMLRLHHFMNEKKGQPKVPGVAEPPGTFKSLQNVFELTLQNEKEMTDLVNGVVGVALENKDYFTFSFLQPFLEEQQHEEAFLSNVLEMLTQIGDNGRDLFFADQEIGRKIEAQGKK